MLYTKTYTIQFTFKAGYPVPWVKVSAAFLTTKSWQNLDKGLAYLPINHNHLPIPFYPTQQWKFKTPMLNHLRISQPI
jgi:hypothetical protein